MDYPVYEIYESSIDELNQLRDILTIIRNENGGDLSLICHDGSLEVIDDYGNTVCEICI